MEIKPEEKPPASTATPPVAEEPAPPSTTVIPDNAVESQATPAKPISAAELVSKDTDKFPDEGTISGEPPLASALGDIPPKPEAPQKNKGGRPPKPPTGDPKIDADRERKRAEYQAKHGSRSTPPPKPSPGSAASPGPIPPPPAPAVDYEALSRMIFGLSTRALAGFFGDEWLPRGEQEARLVVDPLAIYLKTKDIPDLPPGWALIVAAAIYSAPRFQAPTTRQKISGIWGWIKSKIWRNKKKPKSTEKTESEKSNGSA
jgi:hypothetical protein